jgi:hypothetical protein
MKVILKPIFEWLTDGYTLSDNILYNYIAMAIVGLIAFIVAWNIVGNLYRNDIIRGKTVGSILHWTIRLISFCILFACVSLLFRIIRFIISVPLWIWVITIVVLIVGWGMFIITYKKVSRAKHENNILR